MATQEQVEKMLVELHKVRLLVEPVRGEPTTRGDVLDRLEMAAYSLERADGYLVEALSAAILADHLHAEIPDSVKVPF